MASRSALLLLSLLLLAGPAGAARTDLEIALRNELSTDRLYYTLAEIATLRSDDAALLEGLAALRIGRAPRVGQSRGVTRSAVAARIERAFPGLYRRTRWVGPTRTVVRSFGRELPLDTWLDLARDHLAGWLRETSFSYDIWPVETDEIIKLPAGRVEVVPRIAPGATLRKRLRVWLDFLVDGEHYATAPLWFGVSVFREALVATRDLAPGMVLSAGDVTAAVTDVAAASGAFFPAGEAPSDHRVTRGVAAGEVLPRRAVEPVPAIARGEEVVVTARAGPVVVEATVLALEDGREGETIRVRRPGGDTPYQVRVTGRRRATVGEVTR